MNEMTPNKRLTHLRGGFQEPQGMQYSYLGSFVSAVNNLRFCTRRVLEGTVHRTKIPLLSPSLRNSEKCLENLNLKIRNLKMPSKTQCLPRPYRTCSTIIWRPLFHERVLRQLVSALPPKPKVSGSNPTSNTFFLHFFCMACACASHLHHHHDGP